MRARFTTGTAAAQAPMSADMLKFWIDPCAKTWNVAFVIPAARALKGLHGERKVKFEKLAQKAAEEAPDSIITFPIW